MSEELKAAQARIAELEGALSWHEEQRNDMAELRAELEHRNKLISDMQAAWDMALHTIGRQNAELAAIKAQEPAFMWHKGATEDESEVVDVDCACPCCVPLYAAPVSEAKAQGVVMPPSPYMPGSQPTDFTDYELGEIHGRIAMWEEVKRLNAAPVQQVSVPDGPAKMQWPEIVALVNEVLGCEAHKYPCERGSIGHEMTGINFNSLARIIDRVRYAAPAAPAADAGIVDMYRNLQKVTPYRFKKIQDASITDGGDVMYFHKDRFDAALLADMAAHCAANGVV